MSHKCRFFLATFLIALPVLPVAAHDGMVPVFAPLVIGASGKYHLTTNITAPGPVITIGAAATDVDLDLNGFTITETTGAAPVISVPGPGPDHLVIHNGTLAGGTAGIDVPAGAFFVPALRKVVIERIKVHDTAGPGIHLGEVLGAVIRNSEIDAAVGGPGILWDGFIPSKNGTIADNVIRASAGGIAIFGGYSVAIQSNRLEGNFGGAGIEIAGSAVGLIAENTIAGTGADGIVLRSARSMKLFDNVVLDAACNGIHLDLATIDALVWRNLASVNGYGGCPAPQPAGDGILVEGDRNHLDGNTVDGNARFGIHVSGPTSVPANGGGACFNSYRFNSTVSNFGPPGGPCVGAPPAAFIPDFCNNVPVGLCAAGSPGNTSGGSNVKAGTGAF